MNYYLVTEGQTDLAWLKWALAPELMEYQINFLSAGGKSEAISLARSILAVHQEPVILVLDADTANSQEVRNQERTIKELLSSVAPETKWRVFLAVPSFEAWLLTDQGLLREVLKAKLPAEFSTKQNPKEIIKELFQDAHVEYTPKGIEQLGKENKIVPLRETKPIQAIRHSLKELSAA